LITPHQTHSHCDSIFFGKQRPHQHIGTILAPTQLSLRFLKINQQKYSNLLLLSGVNDTLRHTTGLNDTSKGFFTDFNDPFEGCLVGVNNTNKACLTGVNTSELYLAGSLIQAS
jgi:hypothetical protein